MLITTKNFPNSTKKKVNSVLKTDNFETQFWSDTVKEFNKVVLEIQKEVFPDLNLVRHVEIERNSNWFFNIYDISVAYYLEEA